MRKLQEREGQFTITVPKVLVDSLRWEKGDTIRFEPAGKDKLLMIKGGG